MENETPRVLAHGLAQVVPDDLLHNVSGGDMGRWRWKDLTFRFSGPTASFDVVVDI